MAEELNSKLIDARYTLAVLQREYDDVSREYGVRCRFEAWDDEAIERLEIMKGLLEVRIKEVTAEIEDLENNTEPIQPWLNSK